MQKLELKQETAEAAAVNREANLKEQMEMNKAFTLGRLEHLKTLEQRIQMIEDKTQQIQKITLDTKKDIFDAWTKQKMETLSSQQKL